MTRTPWIKLFALGAMVWMVFGASAVGVSLAMSFGVLFALLDATMAEEDRGGKREDRPPRPLMTDAVQMVRQLFSRRVGPFYLALAVLTWAGLEARHGDREKGRLGEAESGLPASRGWSAADASGAHQPSSQSGLCACGKPLGHDKAGAPPSPEATKRIEALKKRTMSAAPSVPAANLPGIGPNAKPLPPGLVPNPNAKLPPGIAPAAPANPPPPPTPGSVNARQLPVGGGESPEVGATESQTPSPMPQAPSSAPQPPSPVPPAPSSNTSSSPAPGSIIGGPKPEVRASEPPPAGK